MMPRNQYMLVKKYNPPKLLSQAIIFFVFKFPFLCMIITLKKLIRDQGFSTWCLLEIHSLGFFLLPFSFIYCKKIYNYTLFYVNPFGVIPYLS